MLKIAINGACGRMGARIAALVFEDSQLKLAAALERQGHPSLGKDVGTIAGCGETNIKVTSTLNTHADVVIDFSSPNTSQHKEPMGWDYPSFSSPSTASITAR